MNFAIKLTILFLGNPDSQKLEFTNLFQFCQKMIYPITFALCKKFKPIFAIFMQIYSFVTVEF